MAKWVAAGSMVMVRVKNPQTLIQIANDKRGFVPEGVLVSMGNLAVREFGDGLINQTVRFMPQMQREVFGDIEKDEFLFVVVPWEAIIAALEPEENDA